MTPQDRFEEHHVRALAARGLLQPEAPPPSASETAAALEAAVIAEIKKPERIGHKIDTRESNVSSPSPANHGGSMFSTIVLFLDSALTKGGKFVAGATLGAGTAYAAGTYGGERLAAAATTTGLATGAVLGTAVVGGLQYKANAIKTQLSAPAAAAAAAASAAPAAPAAAAA